MGKCDILHYVSRDKFTSGYIDFMKIYMDRYQHFFITTKSDRYPLSTKDDENIYIIENLSDLIVDDTIVDLICRCNKFIISGVFGIQRYLISFNECILKKVYLQFWGGDFYEYRNFSDIDSENDKDIMNELIEKCQGIINLIPYDYQELQKVFSVSKKNFIAPVPCPPIKIEKYIERPVKDKIYKILIGNSATKENHHVEVFEFLSSKNLRDVEIYSPLSYGDEKYKEYVIRMGRKTFGEKFYPLSEFLPFDKYMCFLSTCDVGVFNNDRQQAMGNITFMLGMGKKVYLRNGTSMWHVYKQRGFKIFDVEEIKMLSMDDIVRPLDSHEKRRNISLVEKYMSAQYQMDAWMNVFDDINHDIECGVCLPENFPFDIGLLPRDSMYCVMRTVINKGDLKSFLNSMMIRDFGKIIAALVCADIQNVLVGRPSILIENVFWENISNLDDKYILFGTGKNGEGCYQHFKRLGRQKSIICFFDNNINKIGKMFHGIPIYMPNKTILFSDIKFVITSTEYERDMKNQLMDLGCDNHKIVTFRESLLKGYHEFLRRFPMTFHQAI